MGQPFGMDDRLCLGIQGSGIPENPLYDTPGRFSPRGIIGQADDDQLSRNSLVLKALANQDSGTDPVILRMGESNTVFLLVISDDLAVCSSDDPDHAAYGLLSPWKPVLEANHHHVTVHGTAQLRCWYVHDEAFLV